MRMEMGASICIIGLILFFAIFELSRQRCYVLAGFVKTHYGPNVSRFEPCRYESYVSFLLIRILNFI